MGRNFCSEDSWKCEVCLVHKESDTKCAACGTLRPGFTLSTTGTGLSGNGKSDKKKASGIGSGGFTFGGNGNYDGIHCSSNEGKCMDVARD